MLENNLCYVPPIGEELQHVVVKGNGICLHSDVYLLTHISDMRVSDSLLNAIQSRLTEVKDSMPDDLRASFDKLSDFEKMDFTDSRYSQFLSDRIAKTKQFMSDMDKSIQDSKDSEDSKKLALAQKNLRDFIIRLSSPDSNDEDNS